MKVLWFTNTPMPAYFERVGLLNAARGSWMWSLASKLKDVDEIDLAIATAISGSKKEEFEKDNIKYYIMPHAKYISHLFHFKSDINNALEVIEKYKPNIIHIHGTENYYGLITKNPFIKVPVIINMQGILKTCKPHIRKGINFGKYRNFTAKNILALLYQELEWKNGVRRENEIIRCNKFFIGGSTWDESWIKSFNPNANYYRLERIIRDTFYQKKWDIKKIKRNSLIFTSLSLLKGIFNLIDAIRIIKNRGYNISLNIAGNIPNKKSLKYKELMRKINKYSLADTITFIGMQSEKELADKLEESHIFVSPSFIDNESLSIIEAMLVGTPIVSSFVGGVTDTVENNITALMFPAGDEALLADKIIELLNNDELAIKLSQNGRKKARDKYNSEDTIKRQIEIYERILIE